jgi:CubicO group peptidase (beta-lactamase class C family)
MPRLPAMLVCLAVLAGPGHPLRADSAAPPDARTGRAALPDVVELQRIVDRAELGQFWGAVVVTVDGGPALSRGWGFADESLEPIDPETSLFDAGSIAKSFTAAAVLRLVDEGDLELDTPLREIFDDAPPRKGAITVHQLLGHTSGIGRGVRLGRLGTMDDLLQAVWTGTLDSDPGQRFQYSNVGYFLLAAVVEKVAGEPFESAVRRLVLEPAGLTRTGFVGDGEIPGARPTARVGQRGRGDSFRYPWNWGQRGATGVLTTGSDLATWLRVATGDGLLSARSREAMLTPGPGGYGLGWFIETATPVPQAEDDAQAPPFRVHHSGSTGGYRAAAAWYPGADGRPPVGVVVLTNERFDATGLAGALGSAVVPRPAVPSAAMIGLLRYPDPDGDGIVAVDDGLAWEVKPAYRGRMPDGSLLVDERPTVILTDAANGMWPVIVRMDRDEARALAASLRGAIMEVAEDERAKSAPWAGGLRAEFDASGLDLNENRFCELSPGSVLEASADGLDVVVRLVDAATGHTAATVRMGGAETAALMEGLVSVTR